jgi:fructokinase
MFLVCGEAVIDFFQDRRGGELAFAAQTAGSPFNVCTGLARLGHKAALLTGLSRDAFGERLIAKLEEEGVEWRLAPRTDRPTILSFVLVKPDGAPQYAFYGERGADTDVTVSSLPHPLPKAVRAIHAGGFPLAAEPSKTAYATLIRREAGRRFISVDPNIRPALTGDMALHRAHLESLLPCLALIKASREDLGFLYPGMAPEAVARRWLAEGAAAVVITDGPDGAFCLNEAGLVQAPAAAIVPVDTVGAGDSFMSALLAGLTEADLLERQRLAAAPREAIGGLLAYANRAAAITCQRRGANPPTRAEIAAA